jgi:hypothetical protein
MIAISVAIIAISVAMVTMLVTLVTLATCFVALGRPRCALDVHATTVQLLWLGAVVDPMRTASVVPAVVDEIDGSSLVHVVRVNLDVGGLVGRLDVVGFGVCARGRVATD